jgi:hypothetical protein
MGRLGKTTVVVESCRKIPTDNTFRVECVGGAIYRSTAKTTKGRAYEIELTPDGKEPPLAIFNGPLTLGGGTVATTEGRKGK